MADAPRYQRGDRWVWRQHRGSVLVLGPEGDPHQLDAAAAVVWLTLDVSADREEIVSRGADAWPAGADAGLLVDDALEHLEGAGMVATESRAAEPKAGE